VWLQHQQLQSYILILKAIYEQIGPYHKIYVPELSRDDGRDLHKACYVDNIM
jgi:hypothetical protein